MQITTVQNLNSCIKPMAFVLAITFLSGCFGDIPSGVLKPPKMSKVLFNVMQHDEFVTTYVLKDSSLDKVQMRMAAYKTALDSSQCSSEKFEQSIKWYKENPAYFRIVLDSVNKFVNQKRNERYQIKVDLPEEKAQPMVDSLNKPAMQKPLYRKNKNIPLPVDATPGVN